jgi:threonine synthase
MNYLSTRGQTRPHTFSEAVEAGLAAGWRLFLPESLPSIVDKLPAWSKLTYPQLGGGVFHVLRRRFQRTRSGISSRRRPIARFDSPDVAPLRKITDKTYVLELFHGPTLAFKDFALQLLGLLYKRQVGKTGKRLAVLGATSGDTGSAAIHGCHGAAMASRFSFFTPTARGTAARASDGLHGCGQRLRHSRCQALLMTRSAW